MSDSLLRQLWDEAGETFIREEAVRWSDLLGELEAALNAAVAEMYASMEDDHAKWSERAQDTAALARTLDLMRRRSPSAELSDGPPKT